MAFHPLRTFQKNRKFWMATILLVTMITFVLCTGFQGGDFGDWLLRLLGRNRGDEVTRIDGRTIYSQDLNDLKVQRDIANDYMRKAAQFVIGQLKLRTDEAGKNPNDKTREQDLRRYAFLRNALADKLAQPRYFEGGAKLDDLIDFLLWRNQADRLGIHLTDDAVRDLVAAEMYTVSPQTQRDTAWGPQAADYVHREVRQGGFHTANFGIVLRALTDEFRVRMAQVALEKGPGAALKLARENPGLPGPQLEGPMQTRMPVSPEEMYQFYVKERAAAEVALIPVGLANYLDKVPTPTEAELEVLFKEGRARRYDPASLEPGFQLPEKARVTWLTANPKSKFFTGAARAATTLQATPPLLYDPTQPLALAAATYAAQSAARDAWLTQKYEDIRRRNPENYEVAGLGTPYFFLAMYKKGLDEPKPASVAALAAGALDLSALGGAPFAPAAVSAVSGYQAQVFLLEDYRALRDKLAPVVKYERERRVPIGTSIVLSGAMSPLLAAGLDVVAFQDPHFLVDRRPGPPPRASRNNAFQPQTIFDLMKPAEPEPMYLPLLGPVKEDVRRRIETKLAADWAQEIFREVKARLDAKAGGAALTQELAKIQSEPRYRDSLTVRSTGEYRTPFTVGDDPNMAALHKSYEKYFQEVNDKAGLSGAGRLGPDDFGQLFFGAQPFAVGNMTAFNPRPWPPTVTRTPTQMEVLLHRKEAGQQTTRLWDLPDVQAFLFWRTASQPSQPPTSLADVRDEVAHAWKLRKARAAMVPHLRKVTEPLLAAEKGPNPDLWAAVRAVAKKLNPEQPPVLVKDVAPLAEVRVGPGDVSARKIIAYGPYTLPRGKILHPRDDAAKDLLALREQKEPIKTSLADIDTLNAELFKATKDKGKLIQVLANRPQTVFYVAVLVRAPTPSTYDFFRAYRDAAGTNISPYPTDLFVQHCQNDFARQYRAALTRELRRLADMTAISDAVRRQFDRDGVSAP